MGVTPVHANVQFLRLRKRFGFTHLVGSNRRGKVSQSQYSPVMLYKLI